MAESFGVSGVTVNRGGDADNRKSKRMSQMSAGVLSLGLSSNNAHVSFKDADDASKITFHQAVMTMVLNCVGSGILFFPKVMADVGMLMAPILCVLCASVCTESGTLIAKACEMGEESTGESITSYEELANFVGGARMENVVVVTKNFAMAGFIIVYFGLVSDSVAKFFPQPVDGSTMVLIRFAIVFPVFALLAMLKNLKQLAQFAILGIIAMAIECLCLVGASLAIGNAATGLVYEFAPPQETFLEMLGPNGKALSIFLFSYAILATIPSVRSQLKEPSELPSILRTSFSFCSLLNIFIMSAGYYAFGKDSPDNSNDGVSPVYPLVAQVVAIAIIVNLLLSTPLYSYCIISVFEASGDDACRTTLSYPNIAVRAGLIFALAVVNHFLPYAMEVIGLVSSVFACANNILFPLLFFYLARKVLQTTGDLYTETITPVKAFFHVVVLAVGLCVLVFGVQGSMNTLLKKIADSQ